ncbi:hypothetical protein [Dyadobacter sp. NIV53]|uniref:hypothetical protein n=1 Tax=Dyadobacter sp. NIV53 TaxID=2861765 RepID=UPI001C8811AC|nr:hypothetical protein [Dyadobacter sp. NIV53]
MKTVIIPSDFNVESIHVAEAMVRDSKEEVRFIFTHLFHVADDIQDLLFSNYRKKEYEFVSESFRNECKILKDIYSEKLKSITIEFFYGSRLASFKNFLDYNEADCIAYSESYGIPKLSKSSLDALPVIKKCGLPLINTDQIRETSLSDLKHVI